MRKQPTALEIRVQELISLQEAADLLGLHVRTVRRHVSAGLLTAYRVGPRVVRVDRAQVLAMLKPIGPAA